MHGRIANIFRQLRMSDDVHRLWTAACFPKVLLGEAFDLAGLEFFQPPECLFITDVMWLRVQIFKQRGYKLGPIRKIELGCLLEQGCDLCHWGWMAEFRGNASG